MLAEALANVIAFVGIDIGKNSFHVVGLDRRGESYCAKSGRVARLRSGLPTCRPAWLVWRPVLGRIISVVGSGRLVTTLV